MKIKSINTHAAKNSFAALIENYTPTAKFECEIVTDSGTFLGYGATEDEAEKDAANHLEGRQAAEVRIALAKYNAQHGAGNLEIV